MRTIRLDCSGLTCREALHDSLSQTLSLPPWYGWNLDALYDLLCAFPPTRLVLAHPQALEALGAYGQAFLQTLSDAAAENPNLELVLG